MLRPVNPMDDTTSPPPERVRHPLFARFYARVAEAAGAGEHRDEAARVLAPGGELRVYEHVRAPEARRARRQDRVDWLWSRLAGGCHCNRSTTATGEAAGFTFASVRHFEFAPGPIRLPVTPHFIGRAVSPGR